MLFTHNHKITQIFFYLQKIFKLSFADFNFTTLSTLRKSQ